MHHGGHQGREIDREKQTLVCMEHKDIRNLKDLVRCGIYEMDQKLQMILEYY